MFCNVVVTRPFDQVFTYQLKNGQIVKEGSIVSVPFGKVNEQLGIVLEIIKSPVKPTKYKIKNVEKVFDSLVLSKSTIKFIKWTSEYTLAPIGTVLKLFLINKNIFTNLKIDKKNNIFSPSKVLLNKDQKKAVNVINKNLFKKTKPLVLEGVTGSGKTEVFFEAVEMIIQQTKQALIMVPEISLTPQLEERFFKRFGFKPEVWHSKISDKKRKNIWHRCYLGEPLIVVGARSSLFLPFKKLGLIVVDEEHDQSYKQDEGVIYNARDMAVSRASFENIPINLVTAVPSIETYSNVIKKKYSHSRLLNRFKNASLPSCEIIDLNKFKLVNKSWISSKTFEKVNYHLEKGDQVLFYFFKSF